MSETCVFVYNLPERLLVFAAMFGFGNVSAFPDHSNNCVGMVLPECSSL